MQVDGSGEVGACFPEDVVGGLVVEEHCVAVGAAGLEVVEHYSYEAFFGSHAAG